MSTLYVHTQRGAAFVATITRQHKESDGFIRETPWLLLHNTGRVDRFGSASEAREEARKTWPAVTFRKG
jgi:hypothetical protein